MNTKQINFKKHVIVKNKFRIIQLIFISLMLFQQSCKKFVEIPPPDGKITENSVYTGDATSIAVMTGIYNSMNSAPIQGLGSLSIFPGLSADEYTLAASITDMVNLGYYKNALSQIDGTSNISGGELWAPLYRFVFRCNAAIEGLNASNTLTPLVKEQLLGEAKFTRALFYFYLTNLFGDVPLALTTDPQINTLLARSSKSIVYDQIIADLLDAKEKLSENYLDATLLRATIERTRPTKWAAIALLARVYLFREEYAKAEEQASQLINNTTLYGPISSIVLTSAFLKNSREAIWQIQPTAINFNTNEARTLIVPVNGPDNSRPVFLSKSLVNSFETGDQRASLGNWINRRIYNITSTTTDTVYYPFKYKQNTNDPTITTTTLTTNMKEYFMVLRLGEQYLIRAEARAKLGNSSGAQSDLNEIRNRAGLPNTTANDQPALLTAILNERRHELFSEWGNRWLDLKRTGNIDAVMNVVTPQKSNGANTWQSYRQLYPIPITELQLAPNLRQNSGY